MKSVSKKRRGARLGQHFLTGLWAVRKLAAAVHVHPDETLLEIGPGKGALTKELLAVGNTVVAVEKDSSLAELLQQTFSREIESGTLRIVRGDVRDVEPAKLGLAKGTYVVAAYIPYYITGEIIRQFLETDAQPRAMALLVQKEVAERIIARGGKESILSLSVKAYGAPRIVAKVSRGNFSPLPSVDSAILLIENISKDFFADVDEKTFFKVVRSGFASKRKFLANNLVALWKGDVRRVLDECGLPLNSRAEDLPLATWKKIAQKLLQAPRVRET